ncbi:aspartate--tRNA ligase, chloroplastic/mitochondrial isoform X1 [Capsicum annuum]|uniref:aspartate--tRNA ligase, chloroplastic/mitochondrial isoform X1 n=1 Tax=Capsicum annuum TaxID=4072 RepID=UPI0007BF7AFD|nr:aspartate--tRNA ligase, chloroplastic/mitochondrial isoform X1 [Capsicum annuum]
MNGLRLEYVVAIEGVVRPRPAESVNKKMKTGTIEVAAEDVQVLNAVRLKLPFLVTTADDAKDSAKEEIRLRFITFLVPTQLERTITVKNRAGRDCQSIILNRECGSI